MQPFLQYDCRVLPRARFGNESADAWEEKATDAGRLRVAPVPGSTPGLPPGFVQPRGALLPAAERSSSENFTEEAGRFAIFRAMAPHLGDTRGRRIGTDRKKARVEGSKQLAATPAKRAPLTSNRKGCGRILHL